VDVNRLYYGYDQDSDEILEKLLDMYKD
jgi:hypothetical protein